jgi:Tfp pilus assembly protein PilF
MTDPLAGVWQRWIANRPYIPLAADEVFRSFQLAHGGEFMKRWMVVVLVTMCMALGGAPRIFAQGAAKKIKAYNKKAAQDYLKLGLIQAGEGRDAEAAKAFRQALAIMPNWAEAHSLLGSALARVGNYREAEAELRKAVQLKPDYAEGWNFLGEFLQARGKTQEAQDAFRKARQYAR